MEGQTEERNVEILHSEENHDKESKENSTDIDQTTQAQLWDLTRSPRVLKFQITFLHSALKTNAETVVDILLKTDVSVTEKDDFECSALYYAVQSNNRCLIEKIIAKGASVDEPQGTGSESVLSFAIQRRLHNGVDVLMEHGCDVNLKDKIGCAGDHSPFSHAIKTGDMSLVKRIVQAGANLHDTFGIVEKLSPLHLAVQSNHAHIVQLLLENGADVNQYQDASPLFAAVSNFGADSAVVQALLDRVASSDEESSLFPILHEAVRRSDDVLKLLLASGVAVDVEDFRGRTALLVAAQGGRLEAATLLLDAGANVNHADRRGLTPLHLALNEELARLLVERGADLHAKDGEGNNPLLKHALEHRVSRIAPLIAAGSDVDEENNYGVSFARYCRKLSSDSDVCRAASKFISLQISE